MDLTSTSTPTLLEDDRGAILSPCGVYRYLLWRNLRHGRGTLLWVMLNPSVADANIDDHTIRKCMRFADIFGYARIEVVNLFALRSTDPGALLTHPDPVGPDNDGYVREAMAASTKIIVAWGAHKAIVRRQHEFALKFSDQPMECLGVTKNGSPRHPLMLAYATPLQTWCARSSS